ncbi:MAG: alpha/beta fold hydrolase [Aphanocapsa feldmannii 277cV]|uniref:Alpha/beta fold hydrolase n=2 Tax=Aphanocapsa feldmannii TaxID=192050 RepID=A0A524RR48_9CHRO|nr:MAG: alpha/beta fold hydrolase [Aphanocapsa feldmannii 277cV]TGH19607.1 MAG: alpha/beta fold hydrolase [Aphanocapsa feldmannii 277cI]
MSETAPRLVAKAHYDWLGMDCPLLRTGAGQPLLLVHGFGACGLHWRHQLGALGRDHLVLAPDLVGFGDAPMPQPTRGRPYRFADWADQMATLLRTEAHTPVWVVGHSIGALVALELALQHPDAVRGVIAINPSLRQLHRRRQRGLATVTVPLAMALLAWRPLVAGLLRFTRHPPRLRHLLLRAYPSGRHLDNALVDMLAAPARRPGAVAVLQSFGRYDHGPLPEDQLRRCRRPVHLIWGAADPWESVDRGRELSRFGCVRSWHSVEGLGHCPHDEGPEQINPLLLRCMDSTDDAGCRDQPVEGEAA